MKKILLTTILGLSIAISSFAQSGTTGPLSWSISGSTLTISGTGDMRNYDYEGSPWYEYALEGGIVNTVVINEGVTSIGNHAFNSCRGVASITIPSSVTSIRRNAFSSCISLASITIPNSVRTIGESAFSSCRSLFSITIPNSVTSIGMNAFRDCQSLASITIPNSVTTIEYGVFASCYNLASITIPNSVKAIREGAFFACRSLVSVTIPNSVRAIGESAFSNCSSLASITILNGVRSIGDAAFFKCSSLEYIYSHCVYPPEVSSERTFWYVDKSACTLHVPVGSKQRYEAADGWKEFANIVEDATMDITAVTAQERIGIYSNPVSDSFQLTGITDATEITIFDASGNAVINKVVSPSENIAVDNLPAGMYFVQVAGKTLKLMKK